MELGILPKDDYVTMNRNRVESNARPFLGKLRLSQVTPGHLERFLLSLLVKEEGSIERGGRQRSGDKVTMMEATRIWIGQLS